MPIPNIEQPQIIEITELIRLRKYDGNYQVAMEWYQDKETLMLVNGNDNLYDLEKLKCMYEYLNAHGEEYFIEVKKKGHFIPIGDVTLRKITSFKHIDVLHRHHLKILFLIILL